MLFYVMHPYILQKVKKVFPLAEEIKSKLKKKYTEEEEKRQAEEVCIEFNFFFFFFLFLNTSIL